jgi:hypothetical protein
MTTLLSDFTSGDPRLTLVERAVSVAAGLFLAAAATKPRPNPLLNILALAGGSYLAYRGATGYCLVKAALADHRGDARMPALEDAGRHERIG